MAENWPPSDVVGKNNKACGNGPSPLQIGASILALVNSINYWVGRVLAFNAFEIVLDQCSWIPDVGRHHKAIIEGTFNEIEPHGEAVTSIPRMGTVIIEWKHDLPKSAK